MKKWNYRKAHNLRERAFYIMKVILNKIILLISYITLGGAALALLSDMDDNIPFWLFVAFKIFAFIVALAFAVIIWLSKNVIIKKPVIWAERQHITDTSKDFSNLVLKHEIIDAPAPSIKK